MKMLLMLMLWMPLIASAAPRMDSAVGSASPYLATVLPDHENPNLYYYFPQKSEVLIRPNGVQDFAYIESRKYRRWSYTVEAAQLTVGIQLSMNAEALNQKIAEIRAANPAAKFTPVTAFQTGVEESQGANRYFLGSECPRMAGPLEIPVYCTVQINPDLSAGFRKIIRHTQTRVLNYVYRFYGYSDGKIGEYTFSVPLKVGSLEDSPYFFDQYGNSLDSEE